MSGGMDSDRRKRDGLTGDSMPTQQEYHSASLQESLSRVIDLQLPGFHDHVRTGDVGQRSFREMPSETWYRNFIRQVTAAMGKHHFPVYRMADGEFIFAVGWIPEVESGRYGASTRLWKSAKKFIQSLGKNGDCGNPTVWGETYPDRQNLLPHFVRCVRSVSEQGLLALHFTRSPGHFSEEYFGPMCDWFEKNEIALTVDNYTSFYFVYALLCGPECSELLKERSLLLVTSADESKQERISRYLLRKGARRIQFLGISPDRSLLDRIDLGIVEDPVDLALVAGGIGSVNILDQLKPLKTACLDIGICMEIFADPGKRGRTFTVPDGPVD